MTKEIAIFGAGGLGREVLALLIALNEWQLMGFYDDGVKKGTLINGFPCLGGKDVLKEVESPANLVIAIGNPRVKLEIVESLAKNRAIQFPTLVHPSAQLLDRSRIKLGSGCIITAGCVLTTDITIGNHTLINLNASIGHDVKIGEGSSIMPGVNIAGTVTLGKGVLVGSGACILNNKIVNDRAIVGAGAIVTKDVRAGVTVVGVPAIELTKKSM